MPKYTITEANHVNFPNVGDSHPTSECAQRRCSARRCEACSEPASWWITTVNLSPRDGQADPMAWCDAHTDSFLNRQDWLTFDLAHIALTRILP